MVWQLAFWILTLCMNIGLFASNLYQLTCLVDLEADLMNPFETSSIINTWVVPEFILQGVFCAIFVVTGRWFICLFTAPVTGYHVMLFMKRQHLIDVTEVFRALNFERKMRMVKMFFYLIPFIIIIFRFVIAFFNSLAAEEDAVHIF